jgi:hypothetical protein
MRQIEAFSTEATKRTKSFFIAFPLFPSVQNPASKNLANHKIPALNSPMPKGTRPIKRP